MQLHGKTFDYKIPYTTILRLFLLPHRDGRQMFFVVSHNRFHPLSAVCVGQITCTHALVENLMLCEMHCAFFM